MVCRRMRNRTWQPARGTQGTAAPASAYWSPPTSQRCNFGASSPCWRFDFAHAVPRLCQRWSESLAQSANLDIRCLQVVTSETFSNASQQEIELIKNAAIKWAFAEDGVALRAAPFVQNKLAQLLAALASVCPRDCSVTSTTRY